jgi:hypothetical protein
MLVATPAPIVYARGVQKRFWVALALVALAGCREPAANGVRVEDVKTVADGVVVTLAFMRDGATVHPRAAENGQIRAVVSDTDWGAKSSVEKPVCQGDAPVASATIDSGSQSAKLRLPMQCPRVGRKVTRAIEVTFSPETGAPTTAHSYLQSYDLDADKITFSR